MSPATAATAKGGAPIPTLAEPSEADSRNETSTGQSTPRATEGEEKKKRRSLFGFGKKKTEESTKTSKSAPTTQPAPTTTRKTTASPIQTDHGHISPSSPGRAGFASSPRLASPAGSQIFERDVQESAAALLPTSPAIPSHITTENYIPPVLDASSEAITDDHLNPDSVEIITHTSHQPAAVAVTGLSPYEPTWADELAAFSAQRSSTFGGSGGGGGNYTNATTTTNTDTASNYGSFDTTDVRRLSFISFADVVQAEQQQQAAGSRDSMHLAGLTSLGIGNRRSPSPIRSPVSSAGGPGSASPPTSKSGSVKGVEMASGGQGQGGVSSSPKRRPLGSPTSMLSMQLGGGGGGAGSISGGVGGPTVSGEIAIETMSDALRRTGSGDLAVGAGGGVRSFPASPI